jgi:hypothetical protein
VAAELLLRDCRLDHHLTSMFRTPNGLDDLVQVIFGRKVIAAVEYGAGSCWYSSRS